MRKRVRVLVSKLRLCSFSSVAFASGFGAARKARQGLDPLANLGIKRSKKFFSGAATGKENFNGDERVV